MKYGLGLHQHQELFEFQPCSLHGVLFFQKGQSTSEDINQFIDTNEGGVTLEIRSSALPPRTRNLRQIPPSTRGTSDVEPEQTSISPLLQRPFEIAKCGLWGIGRRWFRTFRGLGYLVLMAVVFPIPHVAGLRASNSVGESIKLSVGYGSLIKLISMLARRLWI